MRVLVTLLMLLTTWRAEAQMRLPDVPHFELQFPPAIDPKPSYGQEYDPRDAKRSDETNRGQQSKPFRGRLTAVFDKTLDDPVAFVTLCLGVVAGAQAFFFVWQLILIKAGTQHAKVAAQTAADTARAAAEQARIMRNAERPYLSPFDPELRNFDKAVRAADWSQIMEVWLDITNVGKGVGFIRSFAITHEICRDGEQGRLSPNIRDYIGRMPIGPDSKWDPGCASDVFQINDADREAMLDFQKSLYVYGYVRYFDLLRVTRRTGFLFEYIPNTDKPENSAFAMRPDPMWWFDIEEEPEAEGSDNHRARAAPPSTQD